MGEESWPLGDYGSESDSGNYDNGPRSGREMQSYEPTDNFTSEAMAYNRDHCSTGSSKSIESSAPLEEKLEPHESNGVRTAKNLAAWLLLPPVAYCMLWFAGITGDYFYSVSGLKEDHRYPKFSDIITKRGYPWEFRFWK